MQFRKSREAGFSLLEVLTVVAIISVISTIAVTSAMRSMAEYNLNADAQQLASSLRLARMRAIVLEKDLRFTFANGTCGISDPALTDNSTRRQALPAGTLTASISPLPVILFSGKGGVTFEAPSGDTSAQEFTLTLTNQRGQSVSVSINKNGRTEVSAVSAGH
jgi:prepilin-type N-terminal cleavage/methylation domain-containing protein